ncbi:MAG: peptide deformylase [Candidatus Eremiobacteraeota bacterium]|nr:peptide deformylase [Candidatus Eremiobacteraeota bacterium]
MPYVREILSEGQPTLRKVAKRVDPREIDDPLFQQLIDDMFATMYAAPGVGLAAPQINVAKRVFVMDVHDGEHEPAAVINPKLHLLGEEIELKEGCLSVPGIVGDIVRHERAAVTGLDRYGQRIRIEGDGLLAQCMQHEVDHLDGTLYIDRAKNLRPVAGEEEKETAEA